MKPIKSIPKPCKSKITSTLSRASRIAAICESNFMIVMKTYVSRSILKTTSFVLHLVYTNLEETLRLLGIRFVVSYIGCDKQEKSLSYPLCPGFGVHSNSDSISIAILQIPSKGKIPRSAVENAVSIRHPFFFVCKCYDSIFVIGSIHSSCTIKCVIIHRWTIV